MTTTFKVGERVRLARCIDNFPTIIVDAGETGTIAEVNDEAIYVRMDKHFADLDEWDNGLEIWREWNEDALVRI